MTKLNLKPLALWAVIVLVSVLAIGGIAWALGGLSSPPTQVVENQTIENVEVYNQAPATQSAETDLGGSTNPKIPANWIDVGDVTWKMQRVSLYDGATTTPCAIQSPTATSTLVTGGFSLTTATGTAMKVYMTQSTSQYATSTDTLGAALTIAANTKDTFVASTTAAIFSPNTYFTVGVAGFSTGFNVDGYCTAVWAELE